MATIDLPTIADTLINNNAPTTNYGSNAAIQVGESNGATSVQRTLLKIDFSSIPSGNFITSAVLKITPTGDFTSNVRTLRVYRSLRDWVEAQATWNIYKTSNNWGTAGSGNSTTDYDGAIELGNVSVPANPTLNVPISITLLASEIQKLYDGTYTNNGFFLKMDTEVDDLTSYASQQHGTAAYRPILTVVYESETWITVI